MNMKSLTFGLYSSKMGLFWGSEISNSPHDKTKFLSKVYNIDGKLESFENICYQKVVLCVVIVVKETSITESK